MRFERLQVVVDLLAGEADPRRDRRRRAGLGQLGQQPGPHRIERHRGGGRVLDHFDVVHRIAASRLTNLFVKSGFGAVLSV